MTDEFFGQSNLGLNSWGSIGSAHFTVKNKTSSKKMKTVNSVIIDLIKLIIYNFYFQISTNDGLN